MSRLLEHTAAARNRLHLAVALIESEAHAEAYLELLAARDELERAITRMQVAAPEVVLDANRSAAAVSRAEVDDYERRLKDSCNRTIARPLARAEAAANLTRAARLVDSGAITSPDQILNTR